MSNDLNLPSTTKGLELPIAQILPELLAALTAHQNVILQAEPGAGKTTQVPLSLLNAPWLKGKKILLLEPRRLAAQRSALFIASQLNETVGNTIGYRTRGDSKVSNSTKIEVVTEGILSRLLQQDPSLAEYGIIIFDEFHERSAQADLGLALCLEAQTILRPDLKLLVMSATLDTSRLATLLNQAPLIKCAGRTYPVETHYLPAQPNESLPSLIYRAVNQAISNSQGPASPPHLNSILVFLPGRAEITRCQNLLEQRLPEDQYAILPLFAGATEAQLRAVFERSTSGPSTSGSSTSGPSTSGSSRSHNSPDHQKRRIILATAVAETSLTIDGVTTVIDSGLMRIGRYDAGREMNILDTITVTKAAADQRRGRAGRQAPGVCYRLWPAHAEQGFLSFNTPEILQTDLTPIALELVNWGTPKIEDLRFLDYPSETNYQAALAALRELGAVTTTNCPTEHGKKLARLPLPPRLAHMVVKAQELSRSLSDLAPVNTHGSDKQNYSAEKPREFPQHLSSLACDIAAILEDQQTLSKLNHADVDLFSIVEEFRYFASKNGKPNRKSFKDLKEPCAEHLNEHTGQYHHLHHHQYQQPYQQLSKLKSPLEHSQRLHKQLSIPRSEQAVAPDEVGLLVMLAYSDRIGKLREGSNTRYLLSNGAGAELPTTSKLAGKRFIAVAELKGSGANARIQLAEQLNEGDLRQYLGDKIRDEIEIEIDQNRLSVTATAKKFIGQLPIASERTTPNLSLVKKCFLELIIKNGTKILPWSPAALNLCQRSEWLRLWLLKSSEAVGQRVTQQVSQENSRQNSRQLSQPASIPWPDLSEAPLMDSLDLWLSPFITTASLKDLDLYEALKSIFSWEQLHQLDSLAPSRITLPSGTTTQVDYSRELPTISVKLQEMLGQNSTPTIANGRFALVVELLSPALRPLQITRDLPSFWANSYKQVRVEMQSRYPKHHWPESPLTAPPLSRSLKKKGGW